MLSNTLTYCISGAGVEEVPSTLSDGPTRQLANKRGYFRTLPKSKEALINAILALSARGSRKV
jgi:hypothetical protein